MDLGLEGRVVLVTGGSRGIGAAVAREFGAEGARVAITYHQARARADAVVGEIGRDAMALPMSLGDHDSIERAVAEVIERWGRIDVLINNAVDWGEASGWTAPTFEALDAAVWSAFMATNLGGSYRVAQCVAGGMRERQWGRMVHVSSTIAEDGMVGSGPYSAAKAALHGLTRTLAKDLGPRGVLVNVVMPGLTLTEKNIERLPDEARAEYGEAAPIKRLLGPEEVARVIVFVGSAANTAMTGEIVRASGGRG